MLASLLLALACSSTAKNTSDDTGVTDTSVTDTADTAVTDTSDTASDTSDTQDTAPPVPVYEGGPGELGVTVREVRVDGQDVVWYRPESAGPFSVVLLSHGFARGPEHHEGTARQLASLGFLVATPKLPNFADHAGNGAWLVDELLPAAILESGQDDPPVALMGHSAGGLASLIAASLAGDAVDAYVGLDPVDASGLGSPAARDVRVASLLLHGEGGACNSDANSTDWRLAGDTWHLTVTGATHCDFESDSDGLCTGFCGGEDDARRALAIDYASAFVLATLGGLDASAWMADGARATADRDAGRIAW